MTERPCVRVGLVAAPGAAADEAAAVSDELTRETEQRFPDRDWRFELVADRLIEPPAETTEIVDAARRRLLHEDWDLALLATDLPLRVGRRPMRDHSSPTHRVGVVSVPALGAVHVRRRLLRTLTDLVEELVDYDEGEGDPADYEVRPVEARPGEFAPLYALRVLGANLRLLGGMIRANRPWRFSLRLYRVLVTALATAVFALITGEVWQLADALGPVRQGVGMVAALAVTALTLILAHGLWERAPTPRVRQDVVLFNVATIVTVAIGIVALYAALFVVTLAIAGLFVAPSVLGDILGHDASFGDFLELGWLVSSVATVGGALGGALETGAAVREAAYAHADEDEEDAARERADG